jgi:hypothetical protein
MLSLPSANVRAMKDALTPVRLLRYNSLRIPWAGGTVQHELGCAESWHGCVVGSFPLTMWLPRQYRPSELSTQEKPRQMGKEGYTINT